MASSHFFGFEWLATFFIKASGIKALVDFADRFSRAID